MDYDVAIVGARVAGSSLALLLGERGYRVLMVDRDSLPSDTLSTVCTSARSRRWLGSACLPTWRPWAYGG